MMVACSAELDVSILAPSPASPAGSDACLSQLTSLGVDFTIAAPLEGVATPVTVKPPIHGMRYRYEPNTAPRTSFTMDCPLAVALVHGADVLAAAGVVEVADLGVYNYRCIDQTVSPP